MSRQTVRRGRISVTADLTGLGRVLGVAAGISNTTSKPHYAEDVITYAHGKMSQAFDLEMDAMVNIDRRYSHVYDWNPTRQYGPEDRLWLHQLEGRGGQRIATWTWKASVRPIPTPIERYRDSKNEDDWIKNISEEDVMKMGKRKYVFNWKAPIMEYGTSVNIRPVYAKMILTPTNNQRGYKLVDEQDASPGATVGTQWKFTEYWVGYWGNHGQKRFNDSVRPVLENDLKSAEAGIRMGPGTKQGGKLSTFKDFERAKEAGRRWAEEYLENRASYYRGAKRQ